MKLYLSTEPYDPVSAIIRWNTRCPWSHAGFVNTDTGYTFGAMIDGGVEWRKPSKKAIGVMLDAPGTELAFRWAITQNGKPYDWTGITGMALDRSWRDDDAWFCSELVAASFEKVNLPLFNIDAPVWRITPRDLTLSPLITALYQFKFSKFYE